VGLSSLEPWVPWRIAYPGRSLWRVYRGQPTDFMFSQSDEIQAVPLWTSGTVPLDVSVEFVASCTKPECSAEIITEGFGPYDGARLPIRLRSMIPYIADITADHGGYLETHRMYLPGYRARVEGQPAQVLKSPEGNAMVAVPAGTSTVELVYQGTLLMRLSWWISLATWVATGGWFVCQTAFRRLLLKRTASGDPGHPYPRT
jgi:hypothetical protein